MVERMQCRKCKLRPAMENSLLCSHCAIIEKKERIVREALEWVEYKKTYERRLLSTAEMFSK